eukprot:scaffold62347_cov28-Tisochrysis_lutea.AAC.3
MSVRHVDAKVPGVAPSCLFLVSTSRSLSTAAIFRSISALNTSSAFSRAWNGVHVRSSRVSNAVRTLAVVIRRALCQASIRHLCKLYREP